MRTIRQLLAGEDEIQLAVRLALLALLVYWTFVLIRPAKTVPPDAEAVAKS